MDIKEKLIQELENSKIVTILGVRGSGKTSFGFWLLNEVYSNYPDKNIYILNYQKDNLPDWIQNIDDLDEVESDSVVLVDEAYIQMDSRKSMSSQNVKFSHILQVSRHNNLSLIFITQNPDLVDKRLRMVTDIWCLKEIDLYTNLKGDKFIKELYKGVKTKKGNIYVRAREFKGYLDYELVDFWDEDISKSYSKDTEKGSFGDSLNDVFNQIGNALTGNKSLSVDKGISKINKKIDNSKIQNKKEVKWILIGVSIIVLAMFAKYLIFIGVVIIIWILIDMANKKGKGKRE